MQTVAIMQPYFIPYAGYFRLFAAADVFVALDCVQFPRRGWVHRNQLIGREGVPAWLTLALTKAQRETRIADMKLAPDFLTRLNHKARAFTALSSPNPTATRLANAMRVPRESLVDYNLALLDVVLRELEISCPIVRSSGLNLPQTLRGQARIVEIARRLAANTYINAPGGRDLYDPAVFASEGLELRFLDPYDGPTTSILQRLHDEALPRLRQEILRSSRFS